MRPPRSLLSALNAFDDLLGRNVARLRAQAAAADAQFEKKEHVAFVALRTIQYEDALAASGQIRELESHDAGELCEHCLDTASGVSRR